MCELPPPVGRELSVGAVKLLEDIVYRWGGELTVLACRPQGLTCCQSYD
jgi:hypothetical protein